MNCIISAPMVWASTVLSEITRSAVPQRPAVDRGPLLGVHEIPHRASGEVVKIGAGGLRDQAVDPPAGSRERAQDHGEQLVRRAIPPELELAVLVHGAERVDRRGAVTIFAEAFRPKLRNHLPSRSSRST